ncbi:MAG: carbamoyltransferase HypF, partial [Bacteroidota bacterium]
EYQDPSDRRFWSQTNSCSTCGIQQTLYGADQQILSTNDSEILNWVTQSWKAGQIVAIKGIGGFLLTVDATNPEAVQTLRDRKQRPTKPFALMFADMKTIKSNFEVSESQIDQLGYPQASIVLLRNKPYTFKQLALEQIGPGLDQTGVMVAYTPLFQLLLDQFERPIVATSGNVSGSPIVFGNEPALTAFKGIADLILTNDRAIALPQDDSVVRFSPEKLKRIIIRRSRGLAPNYFGPPVFPEVGQAILALGGQLKSGFGLQHEQQTYLSQYLGDLDHFDTQENFQRSLSHLSSVLGFEPEVVLTDLHPAYFTTDFGAQIGQQHQIPVVQIQHHEAHFCAVLGEHDLFDSNAPIMGMVWDGTGLGTDQQIWGSECFLYQDQQIERLGHFDYFPWILNNKMAREPRLSALAICHDLHLAEAVLKPKFSETEWKIYTKRLANNPQLKTSSMGRIFDAMACLLGFKSQQSFEGEAAMLLEQAAQGYLDKHQIIKQANGQLEPYSGGWNTKLLFQEVLEDLATGLSIEYIAAKLHWTLVEVIRASAQKAGVQHIAFSGGVFQNGVLVDLLLHFLSEDFQLYFHKTLSPNDENLAFGQIMWYQWQANKTKVDHSNTKNYVFSNSR